MESGKIIIITAPSGAGKTSIVRHLLKKYPAQFGFSISAATRQPRANEQHGKDYYFMSVEQFQKHISNNDFLEWEMVYEGKYYGTLHAEIERLWQQNKTPILDIDVKGAIHIQEQLGNNCLSIFIKPPSIAALTQRLQNRGTETQESLQTRIDKASYELSFCHHFNAEVVNDDLDTAIAATEALILNFVK
jgi:guanylate kinase